MLYEVITPAVIVTAERIEKHQIGIANRWTVRAVAGGLPVPIGRWVGQQFFEGWFGLSLHQGSRITSYNVCYTKLLRAVNRSYWHCFSETSPYPPQPLHAKTPLLQYPVQLPPALLLIRWNINSYDKLWWSTFTFFSTPPLLRGSLALPWCKLKPNQPSKNCWPTHRPIGTVITSYSIHYTKLYDARAIDLIFHQGEIGETYNIGGDNEWTNLDLILKLCEIMDKKLNRASGESKNLITYVKDRAGHDKRYAIDFSKLNAALGWKPSLNFEEGLELTVDWYLNNVA